MKKHLITLTIALMSLSTYATAKRVAVTSCPTTAAISDQHIKAKYNDLNWYVGGIELGKFREGKVITGTIDKSFLLCIYEKGITMALEHFPKQYSRGTCSFDKEIIQKKTLQCKDKGPKKCIVYCNESEE